MLLNEARAVRDRLTRIEAAKASVDEAMALSAKANELTTFNARVQALSARNRQLRERDVPRSATLDTTNTLQIISRRVAEINHPGGWSALVETNGRTRGIFDLDRNLAEARLGETLRHSVVRRCAA